MRYSPSRPLRSSRAFAGIVPIVLTAIGIGAAIIVIGAGLFVRSKALMQEELQERLKDTAAAAALQFDSSVIEQLTGSIEELENTDFQNIVHRLQRIRRTIPGIRYAYLMRRTDDPDTLAFIADADLLLPDTELDRNGNGTVDPDEEPSQPGEEYDVSDFPALKISAFVEPSADSEITTDQWGQLISGYAPIKNADGRTVAVLGLDMQAEEYLRLSHRIFSPVTLLLIVIASVAIGCAMIGMGARRERKNFERIDNERSGLLHLAFHQLGGPLAILRWSLELLREKLEPDAEPIVGNMEEGIARLNAILLTLQEVDLVHAGKVLYAKQEARLSDIIRGIAKEFELRLKHRQQRLTLQLEEDSAMQLDPKLMSGVIRELVNNAVDFSADGGEIIIRSFMLANSMHVEVSDSGCGIPARDIKRIFEAFVRGGNASTHKPDGSGLGLYIVRGIIEHAGGKISIKSREGQGTTVAFSLPL